jgi:transposase-like protein
MRVSVQEKEEIIRLVDRSELGVNKTLRELGIHKSTFYNWYRAYLECMSSKESGPVVRMC